MNSDSSTEKFVPKINFLFSFLFKRLMPNILENFYRPLLVLNADLEVLWGNRRYYDHFRTTARETEGMLLNRLGDGEWDIPELTALLAGLLKRRKEVSDWETTRYFAGLGRRTVLLNARLITGRPEESGGHLLLTFEDISERKQNEEKLKELAFTDELTRLHNRRGFLTRTVERMKLAVRAKAGICLFFADVDGLKAINDAYGHAEGDLALVHVAGILRETFRDSDIIARLSGDEFAILMFAAVEGSEERAAARLKGILKRFNLEHPGRYKLSLTIGACCFRPGDAATIGEMMARADEKLYELKKSRKIIPLTDDSAPSGDSPKDD